MAFRSCRSAAFLASRAVTAAARSTRHQEALQSTSSPLLHVAQQASPLWLRPFSSAPNANFFEIYNRQRQILPLNHLVPDVAVDAWVAPNAVLIGGVTVEDGASVWFGAVLRADLNYISIGAGSNIQDRVVIHATPPNREIFSTETTIGRQVTVGPQSVLTACEIEDEVIIGQRCIVLEGALVEKNAILGDGTVVAEGQLIPGGQLWAGNPAKFVRNLTEDEKASIPTVAYSVKISAGEHAAEFLPVSSAYIEVEKLIESLERAKKADEKKKVAAK